MNLDGKTYIVTGSSMGIGEAIARRIVKLNGRVLVHGLENDLTETVANSLGMPYIVGDLSLPSVCEGIIAKAMDEFGEIHGLVNNAGAVLRNLIEENDADFWDRVMNINARAPMLLIRAALKPLSVSKGYVVNIGSVNAYSGEPNLLAYSASKGALMTMTRNLGDTLHRDYGIKVNQINPGWVLSEGEKKRKIEEGMDDDWFSKLGKDEAPSGRMISPEDIAFTTVNFLTDQFGPISGQVIELSQFPFIGRNAPKC
ncbi:MAG: short-chain dehydrogenase [Verrucomicrobiales bacterium]|nr:short-chain dehydrogenase [Verrucomicrobiales bacterium]MBV63907.1 short-chain dehydrogenase [Rickettsiales bacterium]|tara:strand:- start:1431 stop:2198 length:768 start_codon:yes stop_codon:yes gene_type:complete